MSKIEVNTIDTVTGTTELTLGDSTATTVTLGGSAVFSNVSGHMYPAFEASLSANTTLTDAVFTKIQFDTESLDTDNCYDNATNYRFTPNVAGKYYIYASCDFTSSGNGINDASLTIRKNGGDLKQNFINPISGATTGETIFVATIEDMNGSTDYLEVFANNDVAASQTCQINGGGRRKTSFGAYRIGS